MKSIVLVTLSLFLGTFFLFIGSLKVTHLIHREMHREIRRNFIQYSKVLPFYEQLIGSKISAKFYRLFIGYIEIISGSLLIVLPNHWQLKNLSTVTLLISNLLSLYTHFKLNDKFERLAPSIIFSLMLACRLIVYLQVKKRIENQDKQKEREERRRLIESGHFDLDQLSLSATEDDENESIDDIDDEELEKLIKISKRLQKNQNQKKRTLDKDPLTGHTIEDDSIDKTIELTDSKQEDSFDLNHKEMLIVGDGLGDETKKSI